MKLTGYRRILPHSERAGLRARIEDPRINPQMADSVEGGFVHSPAAAYTDQRMADAETKRLKHLLDAGSPQDESKQYKKARDREIAQLEDAIRRKMVPTRQFKAVRSDSSEYHKTVKHLTTINEDPTLNAQKQRLQSLLRERDPENPRAGSLEYLRDDRRIRT